jgi:hypothetical protein
MENMPGTLSPEEMARLQMFAEALRAPGVQQGAMAFNPAQGGGMQMPQSNVMGNFSSGMKLGNDIKPGVDNLLGSGSSTANFVPYDW